MLSKKPRESAELKFDIINAFGADTNSSYLHPAQFITAKQKCILYPVGHHIIIRELPSSVSEQSNVLSNANNNLTFIYLDSKSKKITSHYVSKEKTIFILCEENFNETYSISLYFFGKIHFDLVSMQKPKRKIITNKYKDFISCSFTSEGNLIGAICKEKESNKSKGLVYNVHNFSSFKLNIVEPCIVFDLSETATKISFNRRMLCTSGKSNISFWHVFENVTKEIKSNLSQTKNYVDHSWVEGTKFPRVITITEQNELIIIEGGFEKNNNKLYNKNILDEINVYSKIDKFIIKQYIYNVFDNGIPSVLQNHSKGVVVGDSKGDLIFFENGKTVNLKSSPNNSLKSDSRSRGTINTSLNSNEGNDTTINYTRVRIIERERQSKVTSISFDTDETMMIVSYASNEIAYSNVDNIFERMRNKSYKLSLKLLCEGFHSGPITSMTIAEQRPILITASNVDNTIRIWNYITGQSEYTKIVLTESEEYHIRVMNILSIAVHPNGYYLAISDTEMIWFFHICYKELRFYGTDCPTRNEQKKSNCNFLKFSHGGHILAAVSGRYVHLIHSISRETIKTIPTEHMQKIQTFSFSDDDRYIYTFGNDGFIYQINLFTFSCEKLASMYINYTDGIYYLNESVNPDDENQKLPREVVVACGVESNNNFAVTELRLPKRTDDTFITMNNCDNTNLSEKLYSMALIKSKKYNFKGIASGTEDGIVNLFPMPFSSNKEKWDTIHSHNGQISQVLFNQDSGLLFSCGVDGNIFVYCIYEYIDGENYTGDRITNLNQLGNILDEGLGDHVLYPIDALSKFDDLREESKEIALKYELRENALKNDFASQLKAKEREIIEKKEIEIKKLNEMILELTVKQKEIVEEYEKKLQAQIEESRKKFNDQNTISQERIKGLEKDLANLEDDFEALKKEKEAEMKEKSNLFRKRFQKLETELKNRVKDIENEKISLADALADKEKKTKVMLEKIDEEFENERNVILKNQEEKDDDYKFQIENMHYEIIRLKDQKKKLEDTISDKEKDIRVLNDKVLEMQNLVSVLKNSIETKDNEKQALVKKVSELEQFVQDKERLGQFTNKLKNELYRKNVELTSMCKAKELENESYFLKNKQLRKSITSTVNKVMSQGKEKKQLLIMIDSLKQEIENLRKKSNIVQNSFDDILLKIYEAFRTNSKNEIFRTICQIYRLYLTDEFLSKGSKDIMIDIRVELEKQIGALENNLLQEEVTREKVDALHDLYKENKIEENSKLLTNCTRLKVKNNDLEKEVSSLRGMNNALRKRIENLKYERINLPKLKKSNSTGNYIDENEVLKEIKSNYENASQGSASSSNNKKNTPSSLMSIQKINFK